MSDLINYLPCLKCDSSSNIIRIDYYDKEDCLYLKLSCIKKCSDNYIKFSDLIIQFDKLFKINIKLNYIFLKIKIFLFMEIIAKRTKRLKVYLIK